MKKAYIILTYTGTILSRIVRIYNRSEYGHVSISIDDNLLEMYSFGRKKAYNAFIGGFVRESTDQGTFKRFKNAKTTILEIELTPYQYRKLKRIIKKFNRDKELYKFNTLGLFFTTINKRVKNPNKFYCAEFVKYTLDEIHYENNLPNIVVPKDFLKLNGSKTIYKGKLKNYKK